MKVLDIVKAIRQLSKLTLVERRDAIEKLLKAIDVLSIDCEKLVCVKHALEITGHKSHHSAYHSSHYKRLHQFRVCCRDFYAKAEVELVPKAGPKGNVRRVKVGLDGR